MFRIPYHGTCGGLHVADAPALEATDVVVTYPGSDAPALAGVSLRVERGQRVALLGGNGAGKSTLLKAAAGLVPIAAGGVRLLGHGVGACHHQVAYLPQRNRIDWDFPLTVRRLAMTGCYVHLGWLKRPGRVHRERLAEILHLLHMAPFADRLIHRLSGGQQQRALLARTLLHDPELYLLDEPMTGVDASTRAIFNAVLDRLKTEGKTVIMATHDVIDIDRAFDASLHLEAGKLVQL